MAIVARGQITVTDLVDGYGTTTNFLALPAPPYRVGDTATVDDELWACIRERLATPDPAQRVNIATNPSFELASGTYVTVRTNLANTFDVDVGTGGVVTKTTGTTALGAPSLKATWTTAPTGGDRRLKVQNGATSTLDSAPGGKTYTARANVASNLPSGVYVMLEYSATSGGTTNYYNKVGTKIIDETPGESIVTFDVPATAPNGGTPINLNVFVTPVLQSEVALNSYICADAPDVENAPVLGPWFDGAHQPVEAGGFIDPDFTVAWSGAAGASTSTLSARQPSGFTDESIVRVHSTRWAKVGANAIRLIPNASGSASRIRVGTATTTTFFLPGRTYRASAILRLEKPQSGTLDPLARAMLAAGINSAGTSTRWAEGAKAPNVAGEHKVALTWSVPATAQQGGAFFLYNGASVGNGEVWWDALIIEDVTDVMPADDSYFDGGFSPDGGKLPAWSGTPNASASTLTWQKQNDWQRQDVSADARARANEVDATLRQTLVETVDQINSLMLQLPDSILQQVSAQYAKRIYELDPTTGKETDKEINVRNELSRLTQTAQSLAFSLQSTEQILTGRQDATDTQMKVMRDVLTLFRLEADGLWIGKSDSPVTMRLSNTSLDFFFNGPTGAVLIAEFDGGDNHMTIFDATVRNELTVKTVSAYAVSSTTVTVGTERWAVEPSGGMSLVGA